MPSDPPPPHRLTRRRLLALTALTAAAPLGAGWRPAPAGAEPDDDAAYQKAFETALARDPNVRRYGKQGREFLYRPRQILVARADAGRVLAWLQEAGFRVAAEGEFAGVVRVQFDREVDVPSIVAKLRDPATWPRQGVPAVQPHHVLVGFGNIMGNPGSPPRPAPPLAPPDPARAGEGAGVTVGVGDTGIWVDAGNFHPDWLGGCYAPESDDVDALYLFGDVLALQGGHGTFVAGVVRQAAPGVRVDPEAALAPTGVGDEAMLVGAIARLSAVPILNLSLGGFTQDDVAPLPVVNALAALPASSVVVAAAGNSGVDRPSWPAALPDVVAVAAAAEEKPGTQGSPVVPAPYSNYGSWVDATAMGSRVSTFVEGQMTLPNLPAKVFSGFSTWAGTSFATGHVSGTLAALMSSAKVDAATARTMLLAGPIWRPDYGVFVP